MAQSIFTYSPDGGKTVYAFSPNVRSATLLLGVLGALLGCLSLGLIELAQLAQGILMFFLTANLESLVRLVVLLLLVVLMTAFFRFIRKGGQGDARTFPA